MGRDIQKPKKIYRALGFVFEDRVQVEVDKFRIVASNETQVVFDKEGVFITADREKKSDYGVFLDTPKRENYSLLLGAKLEFTLYLELPDGMEQEAGDKMRSVLRSYLRGEARKALSLYKSVGIQ